MVVDKLETRKATKKRKPTYKRIQSNQYAKFRDIKWRRPKGKGNKDRRNRKGHIGMIQVGYGSPKEVKGMNKDGFQEVIVNNVADLKTITSKKQIAVMARTVGAKKRLAILEEAKKSKIAVAKVKDIDAKIKELTKTPKKSEKKSEKKAEVKEEPKKEEPKAESKKETPKAETKKEAPKKASAKKGGASK